jgi:hypothetical protein
MRSPFWLAPIRLGDGSKVVCADSVDHSFEEADSPPISLWTRAGNQPPIDATSPDTRVGVINIPGVQQQYGRNFRLSVVPYRPPPLIYAPSLGGRH